MINDLIPNIGGIMEQLGIMIYGYNEHDANEIKKNIEKVMGDSIELISASKQESVKVMDILDTYFSKENVFEDKDAKILMFLGFNDQQIGTVFTDLPKDAGFVRPIFCGLTENNVNWPLSELIKDLLAEKEYWSKQEKAKQD